MATPEEQARKLAIKTNKDLDNLFTRMRSPRSRISTTYRNTRRSLKGNLRNPAIVREALALLRRDVQSATEELADEAEAIGISQATENLGLYDLVAGAVDVTIKAGALLAILAALDKQTNATQALANFPDGEALILGDETRVGLLSPGLLFNEMAVLLAMVTSGVFIGLVNGATNQGFKQAVAVLDRHTTDCCKRVDGQVKPLDKPFVLTGTPRFSRLMDLPPFHWNCRTSVAFTLAE